MKTKAASEYMWPENDLKQSFSQVSATTFKIHCHEKTILVFSSILKIAMYWHFDDLFTISRFSKFSNMQQIFVL